jgi:site-specific recombinase XerD
MSATAPIISFRERNRDLAEGFHRWLISRNRSRYTLVSYLETIDYLLEFLGPEDIAQANRSTLSMFTGTLHTRGLTASSINRHVFGLRAFYKWLTWAQIIKQDPARLISTRKQSVFVPRMVSNLEVEKLLSVANVRNKALIELMYGAGPRVSEVSAVRRDDLDFGDGTVGRVLIRHGKGDKERYAYFGSRAIKAIQAYLAQHQSVTEYLFESNRGKRLSTRQIGCILKALSECAGIPHINPHALRHGFATALHNSGADVRHIQELLGHSVVSVTARYLRTSFTSLKDAHDKFHPHGGSNE